MGDVGNLTAEVSVSILSEEKVREIVRDEIEREKERAASNIAAKRSR